SGFETPARAQWLRALFIERERIANHLGDIGAICNDTAFAFLLYQFTRLKEYLMRTNRKLFGHRLLMDRVVPGGAAVDITGDGVSEMLKEMDELSAEFERLVPIYEDNPSLEDRVYATGVLSPETAKDLGVVGLAARSSGQALDCRLQNPFPPYDTIVPKATLLTSGDVHARAWVRIEEIRDSIRMIRAILEAMPAGPISAEVKDPAPGTTGFSAVEGWRGEIIWWLQAGRGTHTKYGPGGINRCMVRDPSSVNWLALEQAVKGNIVPDFPLCNKSFNLSYSGNDL
ncbi:MAG: hypothetical protein HZB83_05870, partial [Deltaproteobacteria bacterium]|nr:hypothetical protein [Deltaproteobacteria bacterium]